MPVWKVSDSGLLPGRHFVLSFFFSRPLLPQMCFKGRVNPSGKFHVFSVVRMRRQCLCDSTANSLENILLLV